MEANSTVTMAFTKNQGNPLGHPSLGCCFAGDFRPCKCSSYRPLASVPGLFVS